MSEGIPQGPSPHERQESIERDRLEQVVRQIQEATEEVTRAKNDKERIQAGRPEGARGVTLLNDAELTEATVTLENARAVLASLTSERQHLLNRIEVSHGDRDLDERPTIH